MHSTPIGERIPSSMEIHENGCFLWAHCEDLIKINDVNRLWNAIVFNSIVSQVIGVQDKEKVDKVGN